MGDRVVITVGLRVVGKETLAPGVSQASALLKYIGQVQLLLKWVLVVMEKLHLLPDLFCVQTEADTSE